MGRRGSPHPSHSKTVHNWPRAAPRAPRSAPPPKLDERGRAYARSTGQSRLLRTEPPPGPRPAGPFRMRGRPLPERLGPPGPASEEIPGRIAVRQGRWGSEERQAPARPAPGAPATPSAPPSAPLDLGAPPPLHFRRVTGITFSPNGQKLAVVTTDRVVYLFDDSGERKDRFKTKSAVKDSTRPYSVRGMGESNACRGPPPPNAPQEPPPFPPSPPLDRRLPNAAATRAPPASVPRSLQPRRHQAGHCPVGQHRVRVQARQRLGGQEVHLQQV